MWDIINSHLDSFSRWRESLNLIQPGTTENLSKEVTRDVLLNQHAFSGIRADLTKAFNISPIFSVTHSFAMGSKALPPYNFGVLFIQNDKVVLNGNVDNEGQVNGRCNILWSPTTVTKIGGSFGSILTGGPQPNTNIHIDQDYLGKDFSLNCKMYNPSFLEGGGAIPTGVLTASYLQSVTKHLALGVEAIWQRPSPLMAPSELGLIYMARYARDDYISTIQIQGSGQLQSSFYKKLSDKVEAGVELNTQLAASSGNPMMGPGGRKEGVASVGAKYEFRQSVVRGQIDSQGKVACVLEKKLNPAILLTFSGELDHAKNTSKIGLGISIEQQSEEMQAQAQAMGLMG